MSWVRKAALMISDRSPIQPFDPTKVRIIDAFWFPDGEEGRIAEGACIMWVDHQSCLQLIREQQAIIDSMMSVWDRQLMNAEVIEPNERCL
jgi:hypothetical protein